MKGLLSLPAILASLVIVAAIPSPAAYDQQYAFDHAQNTPSRWSTISARLMKTFFTFDQSPKDSRVAVPKKSPSDRQPPSHTFARYGGDLVLRFNISTAEEAASLSEAANTLILDVWEYSRDWVDIRLSKESVPLLLGLLPDSLQHAHKPLLREEQLAKAIIDNYSKHQEATSASPLPTRRPFSADLDPSTRAETNIFFADYQPFTVIEPWLRLLSSLFTTHVRHVNIGLSYEGRSIPALRVGVHPTNSDDPNPPKRKTILVMGSLHAREWVSTTTVNYIAYSLITGYGKLPSITRLLEAFDFVFIPVINPDGYVYTWETDRLWRKNRQQTGIRFCQGIDLDRSFGFEWSATDNPCSESFSGEQPFEAVEAHRLADWAHNETQHNNVDFVGFLDLHSYSQQVLYPYSYSCSDTPPGLENLEELAIGLSKAIRTTHGHNYDVMSSCEGNVAYLPGGQKLHLPQMETSGGSALDFFYRTMGVRYAYQIKLRDQGTYGFLLPKENIIPTGKEILNAVLYFGAFLGDLYESDVVRGPELELRKMESGEEGESDGGEIGGEVVESAREEEEEDDDDPWVIVEDVPEEVKWDLRRRRRR